MTYRPIGELCSCITSGGTPSRAKPEYFCTQQEGHRWVKSKELLDCVITDTEEHITDQGLQKSSAKYLPEKTVLVAMYGANVGQLGWLRYPATVNQAICGLVVDPLKANFRYVYYALLATREGLIAKAQGAAQQNLNQDAIKSFEIPSPDLPTQRRIASILSAYDDLIENNTRRIAILDEMARRIYEEWFVHFRFPGHEKVNMVESDLGLIPEGWAFRRLDELYKTASGGTPSRSRTEYFGGEINWVKTQELLDCWIFDTSEKITKVGLDNSSAKVFPTGTVLVAMYGATIGQLGILGAPAATNQACCAVIPFLGNFGTTYAYLTLLARRQELIDLRAGAAQQNISQIVVRKFPMLVPSDHSLLARFAEMVNPLFEFSAVLQRVNVNLRATRDLLLQKLISGELDVSSLSQLEESLAA